MLGLPNVITACLFDLDGVLTQTAKVHSRAWKQIDGVVAEHEHLAGKPAPDASREHGADVVVADLSELLDREDRHA